MELRWKKSFEKAYKKLQKRQQNSVDTALLLFVENPFHERLDNHALRGELIGLRSIDAESDLRILFEELTNGNYEIVSLEAVGSHAQLYG